MSQVFVLFVLAVAVAAIQEVQVVQEAVAEALLGAIISPLLPEPLIPLLWALEVLAVEQ